MRALILTTVVCVTFLISQAAQSQAPKAPQNDSAGQVAASTYEHLATAIVELCVEQGGSITGEHGVGSDKACSMLKMFSPDDLTVMARIRAAFDPQGICNPGKVLPTPRLCGERPGPYRPHPLEAAGVIERM